MKKKIILGFCFLFALLFLWQITKFDYNLFHFYALIEKIINFKTEASQKFLLHFLLTASLLGGYLITMTYYLLLAEDTRDTNKLFLLPVPIFFILFYTHPSLVIWLVTFLFILINWLYAVHIKAYQARHLQINFSTTIYHNVGTFLRNLLIILCLYSFFLNQQQSEIIPKQFLTTVLQNFEENILQNQFINIFPNQKIDFTAKICDTMHLPDKICLEKIQEITNSSTFNTPLNEITFVDTIQLKLEKLIQPFQDFVPYLLAFALFLILMPLTFLLKLFFTGIAFLIHFILRTTKLIEIDVHLVPQEFLK